MAGVNWGLADPRQGYDYLESLQALGNAAAQRQAVQQRGYAFDQQQRQDAARPMLAVRAQAGDYAGAAEQAALAGDFDFANHLDRLDASHHERLGQELQTIGNLSQSLRSVPVEQRMSVAVPILKQAGFGDHELQGLDLSDASLDQYYALSAAGQKALAARNEAYTLAPGAKRYVGDQLVADNPKPNNPDYIFDSESGSWLLKPGTGEGAANIAQPNYVQRGGDPASTGRTQFGWTPRARNGGDNTDAAVDGKISGMSRHLGLNPSDPFPEGMSNIQIARALTLSEGGPGSLADRNNNPANLTDPRTGAYRKFPNREAGLQAAASQVGRNRARGQNTIQTMVEGLPVGGVRPSNNAGVINVRAPKANQGNAPSGYRFNGSNLEPIPGGPADPKTSTQRNVQSNRTAEANLRKEFDGLPEVKSFNTARTQFGTLRDLVKQTPNAQRDMAAIFTFMKTLDPTSTVREGEYASAKNAAGVPDRLQNAYNAAIDGKLLNPKQREQMVSAAYDAYKVFRQAYNNKAEQYRGYARDYGVTPDHVARTYTPTPAKTISRMGQFKIVKVN